MLCVLLLSESLPELLSGYQAFAKQDLTEPIATGRCGCHGFRSIRDRVQGYHRNTQPMT
jgi:hypothetical protein